MTLRTTIENQTHCILLLLLEGFNLVAPL